MKRAAFIKYLKEQSKRCTFQTITTETIPEMKAKVGNTKNPFWIRGKGPAIYKRSTINVVGGPWDFANVVMNEQERHGGDPKYVTGRRAINMQRLDDNGFLLVRCPKCDEPLVCDHPEKKHYLRTLIGRTLSCSYHWLGSGDEVSKDLVLPFLRNSTNAARLRQGVSEPRLERDYFLGNVVAVNMNEETISLED